MSSDILWEEFERTGRIEDYMKYKQTSAENIEEKNEEIDETNKSEGNSN